MIQLVTLACPKYLILPYLRETMGLTVENIVRTAEKAVSLK